MVGASRSVLCRNQLEMWLRYATSYRSASDALMTALAAVTSRRHSERGTSEDAQARTQQERRGPQRGRPTPAFPSGHAGRGGRGAGGGERLILRKRRAESRGAEVEELEEHADVEARLQLAEQQAHPGSRHQGTAKHRLQEGAALEREKATPRAGKADVLPVHHHG